MYHRGTIGRLTLRGNIENSLIFYQRSYQSTAGRSDVHLAALPVHDAINEVLDAALQGDVAVSKQRHISWLGSVNFHVDRVAGLGRFVEVQATVRDGTIGFERLRVQCEHHRRLLGSASRTWRRSHSDLLRPSS